MNLLHWVSTAVVGGMLYRCEETDEYEIFAKEQPEGVTAVFFLRRLVADCDDIGPMDTFKDAEDALIKFLGMLVSFEEQAWRVIAAEIMRPQIETAQAAIESTAEAVVEQHTIDPLERETQ